MKNICNSEIVENWWDYYLVKYGIRRKTTILLKTKPHPMSFVLDKDAFNYKKKLVQIIFMLIKENRIEYDNKANTIKIYSKNNEKKEFKFGFQDIDNIFCIENMLNVGSDFEEYNDDFFLVKIGIDVKFLIRKNTFSDMYVLEENFIKNQYAILYPYLKDSIVVDIGGYIGDTSILFCMKGAKRVYAYELHPKLYSMALLNIRLNKLESKIMFENYGVGRQETVKYIKEEHPYGPTGTFDLGEACEGKDISLKIKPLKNIIENINGIDVLKMDCEGAEFDAILACPPYCLKKLKVMLIEYHNNPLTLIDYIRKAGFKVQIINEHKKGDALLGLLFAEAKKC